MKLSVPLVALAATALPCLAAPELARYYFQMQFGHFTITHNNDGMVTACSDGPGQHGWRWCNPVFPKKNVGVNCNDDHCKLVPKYAKGSVWYFEPFNMNWSGCMTSARPMDIKVFEDKFLPALQHVGICFWDHSTKSEAYRPFPKRLAE
ncbi:hypothetical protein ACQY0O_003225 [Thecaphora frezii]